MNHIFIFNKTVLKHIENLILKWGPKWDFGSKYTIIYV